MAARHSTAAAAPSSPTTSPRRLATAGFLLLAFCVGAAAANNRPIAPHKTAQMGAQDAELLVKLRGYDSDGDKLTYTITKLPAVGSLWQLSQVFSTHGYAPMTTTSSRITTTGAVVTGSQHRIVYKPQPGRMPPNGEWDHFEYTVHDGALASGKGRFVVTGADKDLVKSDFTADTEQWAVVNNGNGGVGVVHEPSSRGALLRYFVFSVEDEMNIDANGNDRNLWYFQAPAKFHGFRVHAYGGSLDFTLAAFSGDFTQENLNHQGFLEGLDGKAPADLAVLECRSCAQHAGVQLVWRADGAFTGEVREFSLPLTEKAGWLINPKNDLLEWVKPDKCTFIEVLSNLSRVKILGDFTKWHESVGLDNVKLTSGKGEIAKPKHLHCYCTNPGTDCPALA